MNKEQTIAKQLNVTKFPFIIKDDKGNEIYREYSIGFWLRSEYDSLGNQIYGEDSNGSWWKQEYNSKGNQIYGEDSNGYWFKREYDNRGEKIYYENSTHGVVMDNRPKSVPEYTMEEVIAKLGHEFKIKK
jgi:hypothetical protein